MDYAFVLPAIVMLAQVPRGAVDVAARIKADRLEIGKEYEIVLEVTLQDGFDASSAGLPAPILQMDVPPSVQIAGKVLQTYQELSKNEFLQAPYERLLNRSSVPIGFTLRKQPAKDETFFLNILAYVQDQSGGESRFVRKRLALAVRGGAVAKEVTPSASGWGIETGLQIGDKMVSFNLPRADGSTVSLDKYLGKKNILVSTYRAFW